MTRQKTTAKPRAVASAGRRAAGDVGHTARLIAEAYEHADDISGGTIYRLSLYLNRLARDTGIDRKGLTRAETYLRAVATPDTGRHTYRAWVETIAREAGEELRTSAPERLRGALALTYTGTPNARQLAIVDALLACARFALTLAPANLTLAPAIYRATFAACRQARDAQAGGEWPPVLEGVATELHGALLDLIDEDRRDHHPPGVSARVRAERMGKLAAWYGNDGAGQGAPDEMPPALAPSVPAVVDLACWRQSHPRRVNNLLFAGKGASDAER